MVDQDYWIGATIAEAAGILNRYAAPPSFEPSTSPSMADSAGSCSAANTDSDSPGASSVVGAASSTGGEVAPSIAGAASSRPANTKARIFPPVRVVPPKPTRPFLGKSPQADEVAGKAGGSVRADSRGRPVTDCGHNGHGIATPPPATWWAPTRCLRVPPR